MTDTTTTKTAPDPAERDLIRRAQAGDLEAQGRLVQRYDRWVHQIVRKYYRPVPHDFDDMMQAGRLGVLKAVMRFDLTTEWQPLTYIKHWIRANVRWTLIAKGFCVRVPINQYSKGGPHHIRRRHTVTFTEMIDVISDGTMREAFADGLVDNGALAEDALGEVDIERRLSAIVEGFLSHADERTRRCIWQYVVEGRTLQSIANDHGLSRERIRQIVTVGLKKLAPPQSKPKDGEGFSDWVTRLAEVGPGDVRANPVCAGTRDSNGRGDGSRRRHVVVQA